MHTQTVSIKTEMQREQSLSGLWDNINQPSSYHYFEFQKQRMSQEWLSEGIMVGHFSNVMKTKLIS